MTVGIDSRQKVVEVSGKSVSIQVLDTAGQERYMSVTPAYCRKTDGIILVYDMFDAMSFAKIKFWKEQVERFAPEHVKFLLLGNKLDGLRSSSEVVTKEMGEAAARELGATFFEVSAKTGRNIDRAMKRFVADILADKSELTKPYEEVITITESSETPTWKDKFCSYCIASSPRAARNS